MPPSTFSVCYGTADTSTRDRSESHAVPARLLNLAHRLGGELTPLTGVGRVGYTCEWVNEAWELRLYLGSIEMRDEGRQQPVSFEMNLSEVWAMFSRVFRAGWYVSAMDTAGGKSYLEIDGEVDGSPLRAKFYSHPPAEMQPALTVSAAGGLQPVF